MLPIKKAKLGTIILVLFYFSATYGFLDTSRTSDQNTRDNRLAKDAEFRVDRVRSLDDGRRSSKHGDFREIRENLDRNNNVIDRRSVFRLERQSRSVNERVIDQNRIRRQTDDRNDRFEQFSRNNRQNPSTRTERNTERRNIHTSNKSQERNSRTETDDRRVSQREVPQVSSRIFDDRRNFERSRSETRRTNDQRRITRENKQEDTSRHRNLEDRRITETSSRSYDRQRISRQQEDMTRNSNFDNRRNTETLSRSEDRRQNSNGQRIRRNYIEEDSRRVVRSDSRSAVHEERTSRFSDRTPRSSEMNRRINMQVPSKDNRRIEYYNVRRKLDENTAERFRVSERNKFTVDSARNRAVIEDRRIDSIRNSNIRRESESDNTNRNSFRNRDARLSLDIASSRRTGRNSERMVNRIESSINPRRFRESIQHQEPSSRRQIRQVEDRVNPATLTRSRSTSTIDQVRNNEQRINPTQRTEFRRTSSVAFRENASPQNRRSEIRLESARRIDNRRISTDVDRISRQRTTNDLEMRISRTSRDSRETAARNNDRILSRTTRNANPTDFTYRIIRKTDERTRSNEGIDSRRSTSASNRVIRKVEPIPSIRTRIERHRDSTERIESRKIPSSANRVRMSRENPDRRNSLTSRRSFSVVYRTNTAIESRVIDNNHIRIERQSGKSSAFQERNTVGRNGIKSSNENAKRIDIRTSRNRDSSENRVVGTERFSRKGVESIRFGNANSRIFERNTLNEKFDNNEGSIAWLNLLKVVLFSLSFAQIIYNSNPKRFYRLSNMMTRNKQKVC